MREALEKSKGVILEVLTPRGSNLRKFLEFTEEMWKTGIDAFSVTDMPLGKVRMAPWAGAHFLLERDMDVLMHFTRTTRNMIRIQSDLLGSYALGVKNLLILSGDDPKHGDYPNTTRVNDISITDLIKLAKSLNDGKDLGGRTIKPSTDFYVGAVFNHRDNIDLVKAKEKVRAGADFLVSQPVFDVKEVENVIYEFNEVKLVLSVVFFKSEKQFRIFSQVPGVNIPKRYLEDLENKSDEYVRDYTLSRVLEIVDELKGKVDGFYVVGIVRDIEGVRRLVEIAKGG